MLQRILNALSVLFLGTLPVEARLLRLEVELRSLISTLHDEAEKFNSAQARHAQAVYRRAVAEGLEIGAETKDEKGSKVANFTSFAEQRQAERITKAALRSKANDLVEAGVLT